MITTRDDGSVTFRFFRPNADSVHLAGTFNGWSPGQHALKSDGDGWWRIDLHFNPGDYRFQYVVDGHDWYPDCAAHGLEMGDLGTWRSLLTIFPDEVASRRRQRRPELLRVVEADHDGLSPIPWSTADEGHTEDEEATPTRKAA